MVETRQWFGFDETPAAGKHGNVKAGRREGDYATHARFVLESVEALVTIPFEAVCFTHHEHIGVSGAHDFDDATHAIRPVSEAAFENVVSHRRQHEKGA
jgi:hypothetical protein